MGKWRPFAGSVRALAQLGRGIEQALVPNSCVFCGAHRGIDEAPVCGPCFDDLPWIERASTWLRNASASAYDSLGVVSRTDSIWIRQSWGSGLSPTRKTGSS